MFSEDRLLYANRAAGDLLGRPAEALVNGEGAPGCLWALVAEEDRGRLARHTRTALRGASPAEGRIELRLARPDGDHRWVELTASPVHFDGAPATLCTAVDLTDRRQAEHAAARQLAFEQLILGISRRFLSLAPPQLAAAIDDALRALADFCDLDQVFFYLRSEPRDTYLRAHEWVAPETVPPPGMESRIGEGDFPWSFGELRRREVLHLPRVADLPPAAAAERAAFEAAGIRSTVGVPAVHRGRPIGLLVCHTVRRELRWSPQEITSLKFLGEILAHALVRQRAEEELTREQERAQVTLASIGDGVIRTDAEGRVDYMNPAAETITGWSLADAAGRPVSEVYRLVGESTHQQRADAVDLCLSRRRTVVLPGVSALRAKDGCERLVRDSVAPILGPTGEAVGAVVVCKDLTQLRELEREMTYLAQHDPLTGLYNRLEFEIYLEVALESARERQASHVLLFLDLLRFRLVNDACGHQAGDELLRQVAALLRSKLRQEDVLARLGGDEIGLLLKNCPVSEARRLAAALLEHLQRHPFEWGGQSFEIGASIGLVPITPSSQSVMEVLKAADAACYLARESGASAIHEYSPDDTELAERYGQIRWVHRFRRAVAHDGFRLYRQTIRPLATDGARSLHEILVRMVGDDGTLIAPTAFIPVVERYQIAPTLDRWVLDHTLRLLAEGCTALNGDPVSINLSGQSLGDESFLDFCLARIRRSGVDPARIYFEITETSAVGNLARALRFMTALKELGCRFILDDFGSGLSSFAYLKNLPVDLLKIDGDFIRSMEQDAVRRAMVQSIHHIGQVMGLPTIAEWVETEAVFDLLASFQVDFAQGFWIHRPEPLAAAG